MGPQFGSVVGTVKRGLGAPFGCKCGAGMLTPLALINDHSLFISCKYWHGEKNVCMSVHEGQGSKNINKHKT